MPGWEFRHLFGVSVDARFTYSYRDCCLASGNPMSFRIMKGRTLVSSMPGDETWPVNRISYSLVLPIRR
jgi:hypothetical protein